jgi:putative hydrolase of the HAD superfamily
MSTRFIDNFDVILLDMGNTFMFDVDRFGEDQDYHATYRELGGKNLSPVEVQTCITDIFDRMLAAARDKARVDDFGDVRRFLEDAKSTYGLHPSEQDLIVQVFSRHELGSISREHVNTLLRLRASHPMGLVSNVWSPSHVFETALQEAGIRDLFTVRVWSSDYLSIKPSVRLFQIALDVFGVATDRVVYVGGNPKRDVAGAKAVGMAAVWIKNQMWPLTPEIPEPDYIISDLTQLLKSNACAENGELRSPGDAITRVPDSTR